MQLTKNFYLYEFLQSESAARAGISMEPSAFVVANLKRLCTEILQPYRDAVGAPIMITSGFRPLELNTLIGGSKTSAHMTGRAADFVVRGKTPLEVCQKISELDLPFDQNIHEFGRWTHVGISTMGEEPRREELTAKKVEGKTRYFLGLSEVKNAKE